MARPCNGREITRILVTLTSGVTLWTRNSSYTSAEVKVTCSTHDNVFPPPAFVTTQVICTKWVKSMSPRRGSASPWRSRSSPHCFNIYKDLAPLLKSQPSFLLFIIQHSHHYPTFFMVYLYIHDPSIALLCLPLGKSRLETPSP